MHGSSRRILKPAGWSFSKGGRAADTLNHFSVEDRFVTAKRTPGPVPCGQAWGSLNF